MAAATDTATFAIDLNPQGAQAGADAAAGALEGLRDQIDEDTAALANMQKALKALQGGTSVNIQAFSNLKKQIEAKKATVAQANEKFLMLGGTFKKTKKPVDDNADALKSLFEHMQKGGGPVGGLAEKLQGLRGLLAGGGAMVVGAVALSAALVAIAGAALVATAALLKYGIAAADAYRSERLQLEGLTKTRNWYGLAADKATDLQASIDTVSASSALGREQIEGLGEGLYKAGLRGAAWADALDGLTIAQSVAGAGQAAMYQSMIAGAGRGSAAVKRVTDDIRARFGNVAKAQMLSLDVQTKKLHESFQGLFRGLNIEKLLEGLKMVTDLFSQNTASGRALKQILEVVMQPLIDGLAFVGPIAKRFYQGMMLAALNVAIAYYDVRLALQDAFGDTKLFQNIDLLTFALEAGKFVVYAMAAGLAALGVSLAVVGAVLAAPIVAFYAIQAAGESVTKWLGSLDWRTLGASLIDGFVGGIMAGVGKVVGAVKGLANAAKNALKTALDSHSPSRVGVAIGRTLPQGGAIGIERDTPLVAKAARRMADAASENAEPDAPRRQRADPAERATLPRSSSLSSGGEPGASPAAAQRGGAVVAPTVNLAFNIHADKGTAEELEPKIRRIVQTELPMALTQALQGAAVALGAAA
jgi:hypothetical protein